MYQPNINNRYFNSIIKKYVNENNLGNNTNICDVDVISQCKNSKDVNYINHITDYNIFGDKYRHYDLLLKKLQKKPNFILKTYLFNKNNLYKLDEVIKSKKIWIIKPQNDYGRHGVKIITNINQIYNWVNKNGKFNEWILQNYVDNPYLINNKKFHFRIYALIVKKNKKIKCYVYNKGFIYSAGIPYNINIIDDKSHLSGEDNKTRVTVFDKKHFLYKDVWHKIKNVVRYSVLPLKDEIICPNKKNCYKMLGFDILIDENKNLFLAEINARLISLKYPPPNFKKDLYNSILNTVYKNNYSNMDDVEQYFNFNKTTIYLLIIFFILLIMYLIYK